MIMTHEDLWMGIVNLARWKKVSCSGLARLSGLDSTTFNKSKRVNRDGSPHWPSTYTIARVLNATGITLAQFATFVPNGCARNQRRRS